MFFQVTVRNIVLGLEGLSPLAAIGVFLRTKKEQKTLDAHSQETLQSKAEEKFIIKTTATTFSEQTDVALQVRSYANGCAKQKCVFGHLRTAKAQISLRIRTI